MEGERFLDLDDLEKVTGGQKTENQNKQLMKISCPYCFEVFETDVQKSKAICPACQKTIELKG